MSITVTPMSAACGAAISGVDLREPLDAATVKEIENAFHEHVVVVFRGQDITEDEQMAFANAFGGLGDRKRHRVNLVPDKGVKNFGEQIVRQNPRQIHAANCRPERILRWLNVDRHKPSSCTPI